MPNDAELAARIGLALLLGGLVGLEREITDKTAGLRTHISVALGATLFAVVSAYGFDALKTPSDSTTFQVDPTRVASNIVTGVGFLGGGAIIKHGASVRGLTTAASMWVTAAIGLAVGLGMYQIATITTAALLLSLWGLRGPRRWVVANLGVRHQQVVLGLRSADDLAEVVAALHALDGIDVRSLAVRKSAEDTVIQADVRAPTAALLSERLAELAELAGVADIDTVGE